MTKNSALIDFALVSWQKRYPIDNQLAEDVVWRNDIEVLLNDVPENVLDIWYYGFTEMFNNALDHSNGKFVKVEVEKTAAGVKLVLIDDGIGIFTKIQKSI